MVPPLGKITNFFRPHVWQNKPRAGSVQDEDNITVVDPQRQSRPPAGRQPTPAIENAKSQDGATYDTGSRPVATRYGEIQAVASQELQRPSTPQTELISTASSGLSPVPTILNTPLSVRIAKVADSPLIFGNDFKTSAAPKQASSEPRNAITTATITTSFSSTSSRRIIQNGIKAVTNSDSDSVSSSSDDEFPDVSSFVPRKRVKITTPGSDIAHAIEVPDEAPTKPRPSAAYKRGRSLPKPQMKYKNSLSDIAQQIEKNNASAARIQQVEAAIERQLKSEEETGNAKFADDILADHSDSERLKAAIARVEALEDPDCFYFFHGQDSLMEKPVDLAPESMPACLTGGMEMPLKSLVDQASTATVPQDVLQWIYCSLQTQPSESLCEQYLDVLQSVLHTGMPSSILDHCLLRNIYSTRTSSLRQSSVRTATSLPDNLIYNVRLLEVLANHITLIDQRASALVDLCLLNVDEHARASPDIQRSIENAIYALLQHKDGITAGQLAIGTILGADFVTQQQTCRTIACLPATSSPLHNFRRLFALRHVLQTSTSIDLASRETGQQLLDKLDQEPLFEVSHKTDWSLFYWTVHVLDIAIEAGFSDFAFLKDINKTSKLEPEPESKDEKLFNRQIDALSRRLRLVASTIPNSGTSQLRRTEAKSALDRLVIRIELSVRTRPKRKSGVFGGHVGSDQRLGFAKFFTAVKSEAEAKDSIKLTKPHEMNRLNAECDTAS